jgi:hypothetical protein
MGAIVYLLFMTAAGGGGGGGHSLPTDYHTDGDDIR